MQGEFWGRSQMVDIGFVDFSEVCFFYFSVLVISKIIF